MSNNPGTSLPPKTGIPQFRHLESVLVTKPPTLTNSLNPGTPTCIDISNLAVLTGGGERVRTDDLRLAKPALSQLSYTPVQTKANKSYQIKTAFY